MIYNYNPIAHSKLSLTAIEIAPGEYRYLRG